MDLPGTRKRKRSQGRFTDVVKEDMERAGVTEWEANELLWWSLKGATERKKEAANMSH